MNLKILTTILLTLSIFIGCKNSSSPAIQKSIPTLTTIQVSGITNNTAISGGNITSGGGSEIITKGVCWSTSSSPTIADSSTNEGGGSGSYTSIITGLCPETTYNMRAYATNSIGTGYGNAVVFSTLSTYNPLAYLGQTPPGRILQAFAQGIIPNDLHCTTTVSPDGQEIYWTNNSAIIMTKIKDNQWTAPEVVSFSGGSTTFMYDDIPVVSPDNKKLFFTSLRPISFSTGNREHIWYVERTDSGWSEPQPLPQVVNSTQGIHWQISVSNSGTLYFGAIQISAKIFFSRVLNDQYTQPEPLTEINNFGDVICPFIAPDESYIIFSKGIDSLPYLYISYKSQNGQWLPPQKINQIPAYMPCSFVSRDGKYLFVNNHWISAEIIEDLRPHTLNNIITEFESNIYNTVKIGNQVWMAENLKTKHTSNSTLLNGVYAYNDDESNVIEMVDYIPGKRR